MDTRGLGAAGMGRLPLLSPLGAEGERSLIQKYDHVVLEQQVPLSPYSGAGCGFTVGALTAGEPA